MKTKITKQIALAVIITFGVFSAAKAQVAYDDQQYNNNDQQYNTQQNNNDQQYSNNQPQQYQQQQVLAPAPNAQESFYYYPSANVYYDINSNHYIYNNGGSWLSVAILPPSIYIGNSPRYMVYHRGPQVWLDNPIHVRNFYRPGYGRAAVAYNNYRPAYRQPIVAYNNFRHDDFGRRGIVRSEVRRDAHFDRGRGNRR